jgi:hypothetical protein
MTVLRTVPAAARPLAPICRHLAVAWGAASVPYLLGFESVPEPLVTFLIASLVGVAGGEMEARANVRRTPPNTRSFAPISPNPPVPTSRPPTGGTPTPQPNGAPKSRTPRRPVLDFDRYERLGSDVAERQCPHCGAFAVKATRLDDGRLEGRCEVCETRWQLDGSRDRPDVSVRSWLHG